MKNIKSIAKTKTLMLLALVMFGFLPVQGQTAHVIGNSNLINQAKANQFAVWLNEGNILLTKIFSKTAGDGKDADDFHAAANGQGRTVSFMRVDTHPQEYLVGGYNPLSWSSIGDYNVTPNNADRKAFLFNLTSNFVQRQKLHFFICTPTGDNDPGLFQTFNFGDLGPVFGSGADIWFDNDLESGSMFNYSYGTTCQINNILNINESRNQTVDYDALEVFKVASTSTAASVSVGGRIQSANGGGISKVVVSLVDANGNMRTALTSPFGYYCFADVEVGTTVTLTVASKRFTFANPTQVINVTDNVSDLGWTAIE